MTAEVAILNKSAVALAADSTVTIQTANVSNPGKTYNSINKLFTLSKHHPVGAMIFGDAQFMGAPWETLIKEYRRQLGEASFPTVKDYLFDFVSFIEKSYFQR